MSPPNHLFHRFSSSLAPYSQLYIVTIDTYFPCARCLLEIFLQERLALYAKRLISSKSIYFSSLKCGSDVVIYKSLGVSLRDSEINLALYQNITLLAVFLKKIFSSSYKFHKLFHAQVLLACSW